MDGIKNLIKRINGIKFDWVKFDSDEKLPLSKVLSIHIMRIVIRSVFQEDKKYYAQVIFRWMFVWILNARI